MKSRWCSFLLAWKRTFCIADLERCSAAFTRSLSFCLKFSSPTVSEYLAIVVICLPPLPRKERALSLHVAKMMLRWNQPLQHCRLMKIDAFFVGVEEEVSFTTCVTDCSWSMCQNCRLWVSLESLKHHGTIGRIGPNLSKNRVNDQGRPYSKLQILMVVVDWIEESGCRHLSSQVSECRCSFFFLGLFRKVCRFCRQQGYAMLAEHLQRFLEVNHSAERSAWGLWRLFGATLASCNGLGRQQCSSLMWCLCQCPVPSESKQQDMSTFQLYFTDVVVCLPYPNVFKWRGTCRCKQYHRRTLL